MKQTELKRLVKDIVKETLKESNDLVFANRNEITIQGRFRIVKLGEDEKDDKSLLFGEETDLQKE